MAIITKQLAEEIAKKLQATKNAKKNRPHDLYVVHHNGRQVAAFGICRGSKKNLGHDHIPKQIFITPHHAKDFAICKLDFGWWINEMQRKGIILPDPEEPTAAK